MQFDKCTHARTAPAREFELCSPVIRAVSVREACTLESRTEMLTLYESDWMGVSSSPWRSPGRLKCTLQFRTFEAAWSALPAMKARSAEMKDCLRTFFSRSSVYQLLRGTVIGDRVPIANYGSCPKTVVFRMSWNGFARVGRSRLIVV